MQAQVVLFAVFTTVADYCAQAAVVVALQVPVDPDVIMPSVAAQHTRQAYIMAHKLC